MCSQCAGLRGCLGLEGKALTLESGHGQGSIIAAGTPRKKDRAPAGCIPLPSHNLWTSGVIPFPLPSPAPGAGGNEPCSGWGWGSQGQGQRRGHLPSEWLQAGAQQLRRRIYVPLPLIGNSVSRRKICTVLRPSFLLYHYYWRKVDLET